MWSIWRAFLSREVLHLLLPNTPEASLDRTPLYINLWALAQWLEKEMATHSSVLAWRIPGTGELGRLSSMGLHRVGHDWSNLAASLLTTDLRTSQSPQSCEPILSKYHCLSLLSLSLSPPPYIPPSHTHTYTYPNGSVSLENPDW